MISLRRSVCLCHQLHAVKPTSRRFLSSGDVYDVVISGGGMVGTAAAAALGKNPLMRDKRVLLLESAAERQYTQPETYSNRVSALSPASKKLLQDVGSWEIIESSGRYQPAKSMYVWDGCSDAKISFGQSAETDDNLAYLVENDLTVHSLSQSVKECSDVVNVQHNTTVDKYLHSQDSKGGLMTVQLNNGVEISARLVIGADGFKSLARQSANIQTVSWNYDQVGVVTTLKLDTQVDGNHTAWQRFLPTGPIAILPLSDEYSSLVWSTSKQHAKHLLSLSAESFVDELNQALNDSSGKDSLVAGITNSYQNVLQSINLDALTGVRSQSTHTRLPPTIIDIDVQSRAMFPFGLMHADKYVTQRMALVGDACHRIHPLAGQGVNLGFGDVECLVRNITEALRLGTDIGWIDQLVAYQTERQRHVVSITAGIDSLYRLYSNDWTPAVLARSIGLMTVDALSPVKKFFMNNAQA